jgi:hypothetical protein
VVARPATAMIAGSSRFRPHLTAFRNQPAIIAV